jgi:hypothetical protein
MWWPTWPWLWELPGERGEELEGGGPSAPVFDHHVKQVGIRHLQHNNNFCNLFVVVSREKRDLERILIFG